MSHIVTINTKIHDPAAVSAACRRLSLAEPVQGTAELFSSEATGLLVRLPEWQYPVVIDTLTGTVRFDNFEGHWGNRVELDKFVQRYAVEKARIEATKRGYAFNERVIEDGNIKVQIIERAVA
jgi:hypothetical protein